MKWGYLKWAYNIANGHKWKISLIILLNIFGILLSLLFVEITQLLIDQISTISLPIKLIFILVLVKLFQLICEDAGNYLKQVSCSEVKQTITSLIFSCLLKCDIKHEQFFHSGDEVNRLTSDAKTVARCITDTIPVSIYAFIQLICTGIYLFFIDPTLTLIVISIMPIALLIGQYYIKQLVPVSRKICSSDSTTISFMQEHLQHHELISSLNQSNYICSKLTFLQKKLLHHIKSGIYIEVASDFIIELGFATGFLSVFIWGIYGLSRNTFTYAQLIAFIQLFAQLQNPFILFKTTYPEFIHSFVSAERLLEFESIPKEDTSIKLLLKGNIGVELRNISFHYTNDSRWIYRDFSYDFKQGSTTAIVGETGAGKSTLLRLILAIISPNEGSVILYDEHTRYQASSLTRANCVYVPQGNSILSGSIRYNMLLGDLNATDNEIKQALFDAAADFVISDFPDGLDTIVGEGGIGISEGQAQRIAIARSFLQPGGLVLMDEPTSALDAETEKIFLKRLPTRTNNKTIIIVTHKHDICNHVSNIIKINYLR